MGLAVTLLFLFRAFMGLSQALPPDSATDDQPAQTEQTKPADQTQKPQNEAHHSAVEVKPGAPVIKQKDIWNETGVFHPFLRMPKYVLQDQKAIWTSPVHTAKSDIKFLRVRDTGVAKLVISQQCANIRA